MAQYGPIQTYRYCRLSRRFAAHPPVPLLPCPIAYLLPHDHCAKYTPTPTAVRPAGTVAWRCCIGLHSPDPRVVANEHLARYSKIRSKGTPSPPAPPPGPTLPSLLGGHPHVASRVDPMHAEVWKRR